MPVKKLSAPVGDSKRITEGKAVKNSKVDVELVQQMLIDNNVSGVTITGKCDSKLINSIKSFQKSSLGYKTPDGIVDPGLPTEKKLVTKYSTAQKKRDSIKYKRVTLKGKCYIVTEDEFKKLVADAIKKLKPMVESYRKQFNTCESIYEEHLKVGMLEKGYLAAVSNMLVMKYSGASLPSSSYLTKASAEVGKVERAISAGKIEDVYKCLPAAETAVNKFTNEMLKYLKAYSNSANTIGVTLGLTTAVGWVVVGAIAGPVLVTGAGLSAVEAAMVAGGTTSALQSLSTEVGKVAMKDKPATPGDLLDAAFNVAVDTLTGAATGVIGASMKLKFVDDIAKRVAPMVVKKMSGVISEKAVQILLKTYLAEAGKSVLTGAAEEAVALFGKSAKSGKLPSEKDLYDSVANILFKALTAGLVKNLQSFNAKWSLAARDAVAKKLGENAIGKLTKDKDIGRMVQAKLVKDIGKGAIGGVAAKFGFDKAIEAAKGNETVDKLSTSAEKAVLADTKIKKMVDDLLQDMIMEERTQTSET